MSNPLSILLARAFGSRRLRDAFGLTPKHVFGPEFDDLVTAADRRLAANAQIVPSDFGPDDRAVVYWYTKDDPTAGLSYRDLNQVLRTAAHAAARQLLTLAVYLVEGLGKLPPRDGPSYRVVRWYDGMPTYTEGDIVSERAFLSSSRNPRNAFAGEYYFTVYGTSGRYIGNMTEFDTEDEVLFRPNTKFLVLMVEDDLKDGTIHVVMEEVS